MQVCLGATYSWAVYVKALRDATGLLQGTVQLPFSVFYFAFPLTMIFSGGLLPRIGPRKSALLGAALFGGGWMIASLGADAFPLTILGIGLLGGMGVGFAYIVPLTVCIQWFPEHRGLVSGIAVAGFGGGAALVSQAAGIMTEQYGFSPFMIFGYLGLLFLVIIGLAGLIMSTPPEIKSATRPTLHLKDFFLQKDFLTLYFAMFSGTAAGLAVNANLKELYVGSGFETGVMAVSFFAVANALGRLCWGWFFDRVRFTTAIIANLLCQAAVMFTSCFFLTSGTGLLIFAVLTGFNYGGVLVVYVSSVAKKWGPLYVSQVYGWLFSSSVFAAFTPSLTGYIFDLTGDFTLSLAVIGIMLLIAVFLMRDVVAIWRFLEGT